MSPNPFLGSSAVTHTFAVTVIKTSCSGASALIAFFLPLHEQQQTSPCWSHHARAASCHGGPWHASLELLLLVGFVSALWQLTRPKTLRWVFVSFMSSDFPSALTLSLYFSLSSSFPVDLQQLPFEVCGGAIGGDHESLTSSPRWTPGFHQCKERFPYVFSPNPLPEQGDKLQAWHSEAHSAALHPD